MIVDAVFDSLCRCFGTNGAPHNGVPTRVAGTERSTAATPYHDEDEILANGTHLPTTTNEAKRRQDKAKNQVKTPEFDVLFDVSPGKGAKKGQRVAADPVGTSAGAADAADVANIKRKANDKKSRGRTTRISPEGRRDEIFRLNRKGLNTPHDTSHHGSHRGDRQSKPQNGNSSQSANGANTQSNNGELPFVSRFLSNNPYLAFPLCFATPIKESEDEFNNDIIVKSTDSDGETLNTCGEDTITSTLYYDAKISHMKESRPPMPLFGEFKVKGGDDDELRRIVATDSHNSLKMISLLEDLQRSSIHSKVPMRLDEEDEEEGSDMEIVEEPLSRAPQTTKSSFRSRVTGNTSVVAKKHMDTYDPPPPAQMLSDSSSNSSGPQQGRSNSQSKQLQKQQAEEYQSRTAYARGSRRRRTTHRQAQRPQPQVLV